MRRAAAGNYEAANGRWQFETETLAIDPHHWGGTRAACRRCQCEPAALVVDHLLRGSPDSLRFSSLGKRGVPFVGRGHAPAAHVRLPLHLPSSAAPKPSPSGEGGPAPAGSDEGCSAKATTSAEKPTFPPLISQKSKIFASFPPGGSLFSTDYTEQKSLSGKGGVRFYSSAQAGFPIVRA